MAHRHRSTLSPYALRQLELVPPSRPMIPRGWRVEEVPRSDGVRSDKYYCEPGSGRRFRSMNEVYRYINGEPCRLQSRRPVPYEKSRGSWRMMVSGGKLLRLDNERSNGHLDVVRAAPSILPDGWIVEEVPRRHEYSTDKYYYEPESGQMFRSLVAVERYLADLNDDVPLSKTLEEIMENKPLAQAFKLENHKSRGSWRMMVSGGKLLRLENERSSDHLDVVRAAPFILPDGWIVEEVPRRYGNSTDKYYYEPESGQMFRSLVAVERYLEDLSDDVPLSKTLEEIMENKPLAQAFKLENHKRKKKKVSRERPPASSFLGPPMKVTWVIASAQGDSWNPFIAEALVPDSVKQQWTNRFKLFMKEGTSNFQSSHA